MGLSILYYFISDDVSTNIFLIIIIALIGLMHTYDTFYGFILDNFDLDKF